MARSHSCSQGGNSLAPSSPKRCLCCAQVVEKFTAHYVFALGLSRFFSCAHWILQLLEGNRYLYSALGSGLWPIMVLLSEVVQTFILADFWWVRACLWVDLREDGVWNSIRGPGGNGRVARSSIFSTSLCYANQMSSSNLVTSAAYQQSHFQLTTLFLSI